MSTGVPTGSEADVQPSVSVAEPVPEQCAACPRYTFVLSQNTKFAVHWAPSVRTWTPGWIVALAAGAHVGAAEADAAPVAHSRARAARRRSRARRCMAGLRRRSTVMGATTHVPRATCADRRGAGTGRRNVRTSLRRHGHPSRSALPAHRDRPVGL